MKTAYRMFKRRKGVFYIENKTTGKQESLHTRNRQEAEQLLAAKNMAESNPLANLAFARVFISASDPKLATRTWKEVMEHLCSKGKESTRDQRRREMARKPLQLLENKVVTQTTADDLLQVLRRGTQLHLASPYADNNPSTRVIANRGPAYLSKLWCRLRFSCIPM